MHPAVYGALYITAFLYEPKGISQGTRTYMYIFVFIVCILCSLLFCDTVLLCVIVFLLCIVLFIVLVLYCVCL
jgi:hypothetical protein